MLFIYPIRIISSCISYLSGGRTSFYQQLFFCLFFSSIVWLWLAKESCWSLLAAVVHHVFLAFQETIGKTFFFFILTNKETVSRSFVWLRFPKDGTTKGAIQQPIIAQYSWLSKFEFGYREMRDPKVYLVQKERWKTGDRNKVRPSLFVYSLQRSYTVLLLLFEFVIFSLLLSFVFVFFFFSNRESH